MTFLGFFWAAAIRAIDGEIVHSDFWNLIVFSDWASRVVTITAAVLRICLSLQMGIFTAMLASLMIERAGVPLTSAPFISMLRAMSASPYSLVTWKPFAMSWKSRLFYTTAVVSSVVITTASQFASTALLSDFAMANITMPREYSDVPWGETGELNNTFEGSKVWNMKPWTYFRFAELSKIPTGGKSSDKYEDTGHVLRALLPFTSESNRNRLRMFEGLAPVLDSRVVCVRPILKQLVFSIPAFSTGGSLIDLDNYREYFIRGEFTFDTNSDDLPIQLTQNRNGWPFNCVVSAQGAGKDKDDWDLSICSAQGGKLQSAGAQYQYYPRLLDLLPHQSTKVFLMFNGSGSDGTMAETLQRHGNFSSESAKWVAVAHNWTKTADRIWTRVHSPENYNNVSVSACFTSLTAIFQNVSISGEDNGGEPSLTWDNAAARYDTEIIQKQYSTQGSDNVSMVSGGSLLLHSKDTWADRNATRLILDSVDDSLPFMNRGKYDYLTDPSPGGTLRTGPKGGGSSRALHYAHSVLFQDTVKATGSLPEALQTVFTITQQMQYYEMMPYFRHKSPVSYIMAEEKLLPVRWLGFGIVIGVITVHFILTTITMVAFLRLTRASWLGNVWMALSQIVSDETKDIIQESTLRSDKEIERSIAKIAPAEGSGSRRRVKIKKNDFNERVESVPL
ncbi:hypothetical protein CGCSCA1_v003953 [Colletotrichum siamense]|nr:hypothetical protein CGCSCA1_v003953 [Colletotrichum siamense]